MSESFRETVDPTDEETGSIATTADRTAVDSATIQRDEVEPTGNEDVDAVVASLDHLDELPVAEHVAIFERAHDALRRTLAGAGHDGPAADRS